MAVETTTIIVADDHPIFRSGLIQVIDKEFGLSVVAEADNGQAALELIKTRSPDIAVLDLDMPEMDGFTVAGEVKKSKLAVRIVILTMHRDAMHFNRAVDLGVSGYVVKEGAAYEIVNCLKMVRTGQVYFSPVLSSFLLNRGRRAADMDAKSGIGDLTPTERRVLFLLSDLKTSREIAAELSVSPRTVDNHRANISSKLNLQGSHALVKFALRHKGEI